MKKAFTLAEVLITLGIIGIIAALTIPGLVADFQEKALKTQAQKAVSVLSQNLQKTVMVDYEGVATCAYNATQSGCADFYDKFTQNMKLVKTCKGNAFKGGCIPKWDLSKVNSANCGWYTQSNVEKNTTAYVLADGMIMVPYMGATSTMALFMVDTNGFKGPNKPGHDLLSLAMDYKAGAVIFSPVSGLVRCLPEADALFVTFEDINN